MNKKLLKGLLFINKIIFYSFLIAGIICVIFDIGRLMFVISLFAAFLFSWIISLVLKSKKISEKYMLLVNLSFLFNLLGEFGFYYHGGFLNYYDKIIHLTISFFITIIVYKYYSMSLKPRKDMIFYTVVGLLCLWEVYEYVGYVVFNLPVVGVLSNGQFEMSPYDDTMWDIILGIFGSLLYLIFKKEHIDKTIKKDVEKIEKRYARTRN